MASSAIYLDDPRFHREFVLPACQAHQAGSPLRIRYADYGYDGGDGDVFMFFGPLLGSRLLHVSQDDIAKKHKIRVLAVDRPGIGGTEAVNIDCRMLVWRGELHRTWILCSRLMTGCRSDSGVTQSPWNSTYYGRLPQRRHDICTGSLITQPDITTP
jgi:hypothetical protein